MESVDDMSLGGNSFVYSSYDDDGKTKQWNTPKDIYFGVEFARIKFTIDSLARATGNGPEDSLPTSSGLISRSSSITSTFGTAYTTAPIEQYQSQQGQSQQVLNSPLELGSQTFNTPPRTSNTSISTANGRLPNAYFQVLPSQQQQDEALLQPTIYTQSLNQVNNAWRMSTNTVVPERYNSVIPLLSQAAQQQQELMISAPNSASQQSFLSNQNQNKHSIIKASDESNGKIRMERNESCQRPANNNSSNTIFSDEEEFQSALESSDTDLAIIGSSLTNPTLCESPNEIPIEKESLLDSSTFSEVKKIAVFGRSNITEVSPSHERQYFFAIEDDPIIYETDDDDDDYDYFDEDDYEYVIEERQIVCNADTKADDNEKSQVSDNGESDLESLMDFCEEEPDYLISDPLERSRAQFHDDENFTHQALFLYTNLRPASTTATNFNPYPARSEICYGPPMTPIHYHLRNGKIHFQDFGCLLLGFNQFGRPIVGLEDSEYISAAMVYSFATMLYECINSPYRDHISQQIEKNLITPYEFACLLGRQQIFQDYLRCVKWSELDRIFPIHQYRFVLSTFYHYNTHESVISMQELERSLCQI